MLLHILSRSSPDHNTPAYPVAIHFNIIISTTPRCYNQPLSSSFPRQVIVRIFFSLKHAGCPSFYPSRLKTAVIIVDDQKLLTFSLCASIEHFLTTSLFVKNIHFSSLFSKKNFTLLIIRCERPSFTPIYHYRKPIVLFI
jgi:hypothetical protein